MKDINYSILASAQSSSVRWDVFLLAITKSRMKGQVKSMGLKKCNMNNLNSVEPDAKQGNLLIIQLKLYEFCWRNPDQVVKYQMNVENKRCSKKKEEGL